MNRLLIKDIVIINEGIRTSGDIYIEGELIKEIGVNLDVDNGIKVIDGNGCIATVSYTHLTLPTSYAV